jgi:phosphoribosyl 1,2-cyclic phosphodiesterase
MMRVRSLGSGSSGNATVVESRDGASTTRVLIDCGFSVRELLRRLESSALDVQDIDAVVITHEHGDHAGCAVTLARRFGLALWTSRGTWAAIGDDADGVRPQWLCDRQPAAIGALQLLPFAVPHDAREPLQFCVSDGDSQLGVLTDIGSLTPTVVERLQGCDALVLECNHDLQMLAASSYPQSLKARIAGSRGHLSNDTAAELLALVQHPRLRHVVAAHLSERNNHPALARDALCGVLGCKPEDVGVADPLTGFDWIDLH